MRARHPRLDRRRRSPALSFPPYGLGLGGGSAGGFFALLTSTRASGVTSAAASRATHPAREPHDRRRLRAACATWGKKPPAESPDRGHHAAQAARL